jgi:hypothetical protein
MIKRILLYTIMFFVLTSVFTTEVNAVTYKIIETVPGIGNEPGIPSGTNAPSLIEYVARIIPFLVGVAAVAAVVMIVIGGMMYMASFGNERLVGEGREYIKWAILGLLLAIIAILVLRTINPKLVNLGLTIPSPNSIEIEAFLGNEPPVERPCTPPENSISTIVESCTTKGCYAIDTFDNQGKIISTEFHCYEPIPPPVTQPPINQPPITQPPVTQPPVNQPPVTQGQPPQQNHQCINASFFQQILAGGPGGICSGAGGFNVDSQFCGSSCSGVCCRIL